MKNIVKLMVLAGVLAGCNNNNTGNSDQTTTDEAVAAAEPARINYNVINVYPHDTSAFTQGLEIHNGKLYESTGGNPEYSTYRSWVGIVDMKTGKALQKVLLDTIHFGEGITILNGKLYQLTWKSHKGFIYDAATLKKQGDFPLKTDGWGITNDGSSLIVSDGSSNLYFLNPADFSTQRILSVTDNNGLVNNINELEFIKGFIYANKWTSDKIFKIDPSNGKVIATADLGGLLNQYAPDFVNDAKIKSGDAVLNGIAYDSTKNLLYVTGKLWPKLFELKME